jgi:hypothetical protein
METTMNPHDWTAIAVALIAAVGGIIIEVLRHRPPKP